MRTLCELIEHKTETTQSATDCQRNLVELRDAFIELEQDNGQYNELIGELETQIEWFDNELLDDELEANRQKQIQHTVHRIRSFCERRSHQS